MALQLTMATATPVGFYLSMTPEEMGEYADLVSEIQSKK